MTAALELRPEVDIRIADDRHHNAILSSWLTSYKNDNPPQLVGVRSQIYYDEHEQTIHDLIGGKKAQKKRSASIVLVAADPEDQKHIFSWLCAEILPRELVVHYVFTYEPFRSPDFKLASTLLGKLLEERGSRKLIATHRTNAVRDKLERLGFTFNPYRFNP